MISTYIMMEKMYLKIRWFVHMYMAISIISESSQNKLLFEGDFDDGISGHGGGYIG